MQNTQLKLSDILDILKKTESNDHMTDVIRSYDQLGCEESILLKITYASEVICLKFSLVYDSDDPVLDNAQDVEFDKFRQLFMKKTKYQDATDQQNDMSIDWNRRKLKFVLGEINSWSKDPSTKVSAAIFNGKYPICTSYNGLPPGVADTEERLNNRELKYKLIQHAEANAISTCARLGIKTEGMTMAVTLFPCTSCAGLIIGAGIKEVITSEPSEDIKKRWGDDFLLSKQIFEEAGVKITIVDTN